MELLARVRASLLDALFAVRKSTECAVDHSFVVFKRIRTSGALLNHVFLGVGPTQEENIFLFVEVVKRASNLEFLALLKQHVNMIVLHAAAGLCRRTLLKGCVKCFIASE